MIGSSRIAFALALFGAGSLALGCGRSTRPDPDDAPSERDSGTDPRQHNDAGPTRMQDAGVQPQPSSAGTRPPDPNWGGRGGGPGAAGVSGAPWPWGFGGDGQPYYGGEGGNGGIGGGPWTPWRAGNGGHGGTFPPGGGGVGGEYWFGASGAQSCECDDHDPCTDDFCSNLGGCRHQSRVTASVDSDDDGFQVGCDCNDADPEVRPTQTAFFSVEPAGPSDFTQPYDYDCDYRVTPLLTSDARDCELHPAGSVCLGDGWVDAIPECGDEGDYQVCEFEDGACVARVVATVQRCR